MQLAQVVNNLPNIKNSKDLANVVTDINKYAYESDVELTYQYRE